MRLVDRKGRQKKPTRNDIMFSLHVDDKFVACSGKEQLDELCDIFQMNKLKYTCEAMNQVLGIGVKYVKYDTQIANSGRLVLDHDTGRSISISADFSS